MKEKVITDIDLKDPKTYELGFLLSPFVPEADKTESINRLIIAPIEAAGGSVTGQTPAIMRKLAYTMSKSVNHKRASFTDAYFGAVRFTITPDKVAALGKTVESDDSIIRILIIEIPPRAQVSTAPSRNSESATDTPMVDETLSEVLTTDAPIDNEQIDMEIEELLTPKAS